MLEYLIFDIRRRRTYNTHYPCTRGGFAKARYKAATFGNCFDVVVARDGKPIALAWDHHHAKQYLEEVKRRLNAMGEIQWQ